MTRSAVLCYAGREVKVCNPPPALGVVADTAEWSDRRPLREPTGTPLNASSRVPRSRAEIRLCCPGWRIGSRVFHHGVTPDQSRPAEVFSIPPPQSACGRHEP